MPRFIRMLAYALTALLGIALIWRIFFYDSPARIVFTPAPEITEPAVTPAQSDLILDLFNPSDTALAAQQSESELKRQIEEAMTINFILRRCELMSQEEYRDTYRALIVYAEQTGLGATRAQATKEIENISQSASAGYSLIYARTSCDLPQLKASAKQLEQWREALLKR